jgi:hypothetical protein
VLTQLIAATNVPFTLPSEGVSYLQASMFLLSRHQNAGQNHDIKIGNRCFENVEQF